MQYNEDDNKSEFVEVICMLKAIVVSLITFVLALLVEASIGVMWNMPGIGIIFAVVLMGGIILYSIEKKK